MAGKRKKTKSKKIDAVLTVSDGERIVVSRTIVSPTMIKAIEPRLADVQLTLRDGDEFDRQASKALATIRRNAPALERLVCAFRAAEFAVMPSDSKSWRSQLHAAAMTGLTDLRRQFDQVAAAADAAAMHVDDGPSYFELILAQERASSALTEFANIVLAYEKAAPSLDAGRPRSPSKGWRESFAQFQVEALLLVCIDTDRKAFAALLSAIWREATGTEAIPREADLVRHAERHATSFKAFMTEQ